MVDSVPKISQFNQQLSQFRLKGSLKQAVTLEREIRQSGVTFDKHTYATLICLYAKHNDGVDHTDQVTKVLSEMLDQGLKPTAETYTDCIVAYSQARKCAEALMTYSDMQNAGLLPTLRTYGAVIKTYLRWGDPVRAFWIYEEITMRRGPIIHQLAIDALVDLNQFDDAQELYEKRVKHTRPPTVTACGKVSNKNVLDVHKLSHGSALMAVFSELEISSKSGQKTKLQVITGKGLHSKSGKMYEMRNYLINYIKEVRMDLDCRIHPYNKGMVIITTNCPYRSDDEMWSSSWEFSDWSPGGWR